MRKTLVVLALLLTLSAVAQNPVRKDRSHTYVEASDLTLVGKMFPDTPNPYSHGDTTKYKGWTDWENFEVRCASSIAVAFETNSTSIKLTPVIGEMYNGVSTNVLSHRGFDLYIRKDGKWLWAANVAPAFQKENQGDLILISGMDGSTHECLLYLPMYSEIKSLQIGVDNGSTLKAIENPFRYRIGVYGSSYTQGVSTGRSGMSYPNIFSRRTGLQVVSFAMSGQCKMQPYAAECIKDADVDAFLFDTFSNPNPQQIKDRLFPFIEKIQSTHPDIPLIFQCTIRRENRNFNTTVDTNEAAKISMADSLMQIACKKYRNVYYIHPDATTKDHEASIDGIHPSDYGYQVWEASIEKKVLRILRKYGIK